MCRSHNGSKDACGEYVFSSRKGPKSCNRSRSEAGGDLERAKRNMALMNIHTNCPHVMI
jgi:hypothetical protein